ncbi:MAG: hypothetical protein OXI44_02115 [Bacteroidota bacterium]|nr:hypothetical protein [Bacteroidota bacterium]
MSSILIQDIRGIYRDAVPIPDAVCSPVRPSLLFAQSYVMQHFLYPESDMIPQMGNIVSYSPRLTSSR